MVRLKHRYLTVHILYPSNDPRASAAAAPLLQIHRASPAGVDAAHLLRLIRKSVEHMYGDYGLGLIASSLKINYWSAATSTAIIRVTRNHFRIVWAALTWMTDIGKLGTYHKATEQPQDCVFRVVRTSGTIRKAEEDVIRRAKEEIIRAKRSSHGIELTGLVAASTKEPANHRDLAGDASERSRIRAAPMVDIDKSDAVDELSDGG